MKNKKMKFTTIPLKEISISDERFKIAPEIRLETLLLSVKQAGLLNPPVLARRDDKNVILSGWKRIAAARKLSLERIPVFFSNEENDRRAFEIPVYENLSIREYTAVEKAEIIAKFKGFGADEEEIRKTYLTLLALPPRPQTEEACTAISSFDDEIKKTAFKKNFAFPVLQKIAAFRPEERKRLLPLLSGLSKNSQVEVMENIWDMIGRDGGGLQKIFDSLGIQRIMRSEKLSPLQKSEKTRRVIRESRYPALSSRRRRFSAALKKMGLPGNMSILTSKNFEEEGLTLHMTCRTQQEWENNIKEMKRLDGEDGITVLFDVLTDDEK
ncbi:MAG: ParB N-terminal domain-containing protein [Candidatus Aminicenantes bacterium]